MIRALLKFFLVGLLTIVAVSLALTVLGGMLSIAAGLASFLLFKVAPILLLGWIAVKIFDKLRNRNSLSAADRRWLEGD